MIFPPNPSPYLFLSHHPHFLLSILPTGVSSPAPMPDLPLRHSSNFNSSPSFHPTLLIPPPLFPPRTPLPQTPPYILHSRSHSPFHNLSHPSSSLFHSPFPFSSYLSCLFDFPPIFPYSHLSSFSFSRSRHAAALAGAEPHQRGDGGRRHRRVLKSRHAELQEGYVVQSCRVP